VLQLGPTQQHGTQHSLRIESHLAGILQNQRTAWVFKNGSQTSHQVRRSRRSSSLRSLAAAVAVAITAAAAAAAAGFSAAALLQASCHKVNDVHCVGPTRICSSDRQPAQSKQQTNRYFPSQATSQFGCGLDALYSF
jgi:hypothetical protein